MKSSGENRSGKRDRIRYSIEQKQKETITDALLNRNRKEIITDTPVKRNRKETQQILQ